MPEFTVDSLDKVSEDIKAAYVEADGQFTLDPDKYAELKAAGLKKKNNELLGKAKQYEAELGKYGKFKPLAEALADVDEDDIPQVIEAWQKRAEKPKADDQKAEMERKLQERAAKKQADEFAKLQTDFQKAQAQLKEYQLWTPLREVAIKAGLDAGDWEVARLELNARGQFGFDEDGKPAVIEDGQPSSVTPEKFFREVYSEQRPKFYRANDAGGSGAKNNTASNTGKKTIKRAEFDALDPGAKMKISKSSDIQIVD